MGAYTRLEVDLQLRADTPSDVLDTLSWMLDKREAPTDLPAHPLFATKRHEWMLWSSSEYHPETKDADNALTQGPDGARLRVLSSFMDYDDEIDKLIDWLGPHVANAPGEAVGSILMDADIIEECDDIIADDGRLMRVRRPRQAEDAWW